MISSRAVRDTENVIDNRFIPEVIIKYENIGKRSLYNFQTKTYHIGLDFKFFAVNDTNPYANPLQPNEEKADLAITSLRIEDKKGFYIFFRIEGIDKLTNKVERLDSYFKYSGRDNRWYVYDCHESEKKQIVDFLKTRISF